MKLRHSFLLAIVLCLLGCDATSTQKNDINSIKDDSKPNVLVIMIDDLNDCIGMLKGHPQSVTPHLDRFASTAVSFMRAYTNAPMCGPSRASLFTGVYPHHSANFYQVAWFNNEVLANTRTMMEQFKEEGYKVLGSGKIMHHPRKQNWTHFENLPDYSPTPFDGKERWPHPDVPKPFADIGWVDGSLGPFINLAGRKSIEGKDLHWTTGNPKAGYKPMRYINDDDRDPTPDEVNASWAANTLHALGSEQDNQAFFLAVGFLRPHTPLVAPKKYFDMFPLEDIKLSIIERNDAQDTHLEFAYKDGDVHALRFGKEMFEAISTAYGSREEGLKRWTQAYLACVAAVDDNVGQVLDALNQSGLSDNTIVVIAGDHGFHMGEKDYLYKNSLWEESTRVPLIVRAPGISKQGLAADQVLSLIDVYPTLLDLCNISRETTKNSKGHELDGNSFKSGLMGSTWKGQSDALSVVYAGDRFKSDPAQQHYALRSNQYRYILYNTGHEELYDHNEDPNEWVNLVGKEKEVNAIIKEFRIQMKQRVAPHSLAGLASLQYEIM